ncbi:MAG: hypothetical protein WCB95_01045, partial [Aeromicrobium sp.]
MSDQATPGSGAGDAAHTSSIPHLEREAETDKGRPRSTTKSAGKPGGSTTSDAATTKKSEPSDGGPKGRPLTASDYARTTSQSPSTTAVIPAVKAEREARSPPQTVSS